MTDISNVVIRRKTK